MRLSRLLQTTLKTMAGIVVILAPSSQVKAQAPAQAAQPPAYSHFSRAIEPAQTPHDPPRLKSIALSPNGKWAVSSKGDGTATIWEAKNGQIVREIKAHNATEKLNRHGAGINAVFSPDSSRLLTIGTREVESNFVLPNGTKAIVPKAEAKFWDIKTGRLLWTIEPLQKPNQPSSGLAFPTFSPDGRLLATGQTYGAISLWDARNGKFLREMAVPFLRLNVLKFSPDSRTLAGAGTRYEGNNDAETMHYTGEILLWNVKTGTLSRNLRHPQVAVSDEIFDIAFSPDASILAAGVGVGHHEKITNGSGRFNTQYGEARLWDLSSGVWMTSVGRPHQRVAVRKVAFSPDGKRLALSGLDDAVRLWDLSSHQLLGTVTRYGVLETKETIEEKPGKPGVFRTETFVQHVNGSYATQIGESSGPDLTKGGVVRVKTIRNVLHGKGVVDARFSPDGKTLSILSEDKQVRLWDVANPQAIQSDMPRRFIPDGGDILAFADRSHTLVGGSWQKLRLWNVRDLQEIRTFDGLHGGAYGGANALAVSPTSDATRNREGSLVATISDVLEWIPQGPNGARSNVRGFEVRIQSSYSGALVQSWKIGGDYKGMDVAFSPDGKTLAACAGFIESGTSSTLEEFRSRRRGLVLVWDVPSGTEKQRFEIKGEVPQSLAFSPDGQVLLCDFNHHGVLSWNLATGQQGRTFHRVPASLEELNRPFPIGMGWGNLNPGKSLAFHPDGKRFARGYEGEGQLWNLETGAMEKVIFDLNEIKRENGGTSRIGDTSYVYFSPDGALLASLSTTKGLKLWDANAAKLLWESKEDRNGRTLDFSRDGKTLVSNFGSGIRFWDLSKVQQGIVN